MILSIYGIIPYPFPRYSIIIYHVYSIIILSVILSSTYVRYAFTEYFPEEFGIAGFNKISDVFILIFILSTAVVHTVVQLDSMLKYNQYFKLVEIMGKVSRGITVSRKCILYEMTHLIMVILGIFITSLYIESEGIRGLLFVRVTWSEVGCRMKIIQYSLYTEIIDGCLSKAILRLSNLKHFGVSKSKEATKEFVDIQEYLRRVNEFEDQIFKYLGISMVASFVFEACSFIVLMYITMLAFTGSEFNSKIGGLFLELVS